MLRRGPTPADSGSGRGSGVELGDARLVGQAKGDELTDPMAHVGVGFPFYLATNSDVSAAVVHLAGAASILLTIGMVAVIAPPLR